MLFVEMGARYYPEIGFEYELEPMTDENKAETAAIAVALGGIENKRVLLPVRRQRGHDSGMAGAI